MLRCYNWNIANDTYVPLPTRTEEADWHLDIAKWLEEYKDYWLYYNFFPYFMTAAGYC